MVIKLTVNIRYLEKFKFLNFIGKESFVKFLLVACIFSEELINTKMIS